MSHNENGTREEGVIVISSDEEQQGQQREEQQSDSDDDLDRMRRTSTVLTEDLDSSWRPWKTSKDIEKEKEKEDLLLKATGGVIDGKFVICHLHGKQRLVMKMHRMPGVVEKYECPSDSQCHVREEGTPGQGGKRYYGAMRDVVAKRRNFKKVCWECGIGEHERYDCPNKLDPVSANPTQYNKGNRNDFAASWRPERHYISPADSKDSFCIICHKKGSTNCCSEVLSLPLCCAACTGSSHTMDECTLAQTNYHGRPSFDRDRGDRRQAPARRPDRYERYDRYDSRDGKGKGKGGRPSEGYYPNAPGKGTPGKGRGYPNMPPSNVGLPSPHMTPPASAGFPPQVAKGMPSGGGSRANDSRGWSRNNEYDPPQYQPPVFSPYPMQGKGRGRGRGRF